MLEHTNGVSGKIVLDSISSEGIRLTTIHVRYPRMIHSELMTHRVFSRNGRSSRAVPVMTLLTEDHYTPHFMKNKPGMVAEEEFTAEELLEVQAIWNDLAEYTKNAVRKLNDKKVHKQWANRPLEAFGYIDVLISSTDWENFMALRDDEAAQPEIKSVAEIIRRLMDVNTPVPLKMDEWHLPYICDDDYAVAKAYIRGSYCGTAMSVSDEEVVSLLQKISTARCARLSIKPYDGNGSIERELERYEKLVVSRPVHSSPAEHIATPDYKSDSEFTGFFEWQNKDKWGNFFGWQQYRHFIPHNTIKDR